MNRKYIWWFIVVLLVAAAIRFYDPTFRSLWGDEGHSVFVAQAFNNDFRAAAIGLVKDSHLPVYFLILSLRFCNIFKRGSVSYVCVFYPGKFSDKARQTPTGINEFAKSFSWLAILEPYGAQFDNLIEIRVKPRGLQVNRDTGPV